MSRLFWNGDSARCCALWLALSGCAASRPPPPLEPADDRPPVELTLPRLGDGAISLRELRGHPVVIAMFATWSLRCQAEAPLFVQLYERGQRRGLRLVGIALDGRARKLIQTYVDFVGFRFPVALAAPNDPTLVAAIGKTRVVPRTLLLDAKGRLVQDHHTGQTDFPRLERGVRTLLGRR